MAQFVEVNGQIIEFPDGMSAGDMEGAIKANFMSIKPAQKAAPVRSWSDVPLEAIKNTPASAGNFAQGIYQALRHPLDTAGGLADAAAGGFKNALPKGLTDFVDKFDPNPEAGKRAVATADAIGSFYKDRYGSSEGLKKTIATDPVGFAGDLSMLFGGGAALAGKVPKMGGVADALSTAQRYTNPLNVARPILSMTANSVLKPAAQRLMQSAIKPTIKQLKTGDARIAVDTLLDLGINPTSGGVGKLRSFVDDINSNITNKLSGSNATVSRAGVANYLDDVRGKFGNQVSPSSDLGAIGGVLDDFMAHPGIVGDNIPVQQAQLLKQGTYKALSGKYGEAGSAATEAQKALARGLKEGISSAVPGVGALNAQEARLIKTIGVAERRALMELNKNPVGLAALAGNPVGFVAFMADRSAAFKSIAARMVNQAAKATSGAQGLLGSPSNPVTANQLLMANQAGRLPLDAP